MKPIYIELTPATGKEEVIMINFMEVDDIIASHGNESDFKGNVTHYGNGELPYTIIVIGDKRIPVVQSTNEVIKKIHAEIINQLNRVRR